MAMGKKKMAESEAGSSDQTVRVGRPKRLMSTSDLKDVTSRRRAGTVYLAETGVRAHPQGETWGWGDLSNEKAPTEAGTE